MEMAERFGERVRGVAGESETVRLDAAFRLALSRPPSAEEVSLCTAHLSRQSHRYQTDKKLSPQDAANAALVDVCQMLLNTNEFLFVE